MSTTRSALPGGLTLTDAIEELAVRGYPGHFFVRPGGLLECEACGTRLGPSRVRLEAMRRVEGASDPADMAVVGALRCPRCDATGTAVVRFGPDADADHAVVLRELDNQRASRELTLRAGEEHDSLVSDTGWLRGPDG